MKEEALRDFSIIIPVYNEAGRVPKNIDAIFGFLETLGWTTEVIFVNDGSTDDTGKVLESYQKDLGFKVVGYQKNRGKGYAVRQGALAAAGRWIVFFDIDLATPITELGKLPPLAAGPNSVIIGSRRLAGSRIERGESKIRTLLGKGFGLLSKIFVPEITDFTCGFKAFRREAAREIFGAARINRWAFDTEILFIAKLKGFSIKQIPVSWRHDNDSRVRVLRDILRSAVELLLIALNLFAGRYGKSGQNNKELKTD